MKLNCPACGKQIAAEDIALAAGWAKCSRCDDVFELRLVLPGYTLPGEIDARERPFDAWASLERKDRQLFIHVPAHGMRATSWGLLAFAAMWLGFVAFWTLGALGLFGQQENAGPQFAAFSIPFWLVGLLILCVVVWITRSANSLYLDPAQMISETTCLFFRRHKVRNRELVQHARRGVTKMKSNDESSPFNFPVEIVFRSGSVQLPCENSAEQGWLVAEINDFLISVPYDPTFSREPTTGQGVERRLA